MEQFKIDLFKNEYNVDLPNFTNLTNKECGDLEKKIIDKYNLHDITDIYKLFENGKPVYFIEDIFNLLNTLELLNIKPNLQVYLNWYSFTDIDILNIIFLDKYFFDIWYPISDDIDIFDESLNWFLSIRHDGNVVLLTSNSDKDSDSAIIK